MISTFQGKASFFSWLYRILFNLNRAAWRKRSKLPLIFTDEVPDVASDGPLAVVNSGTFAAASRRGNRGSGLQTAAYPPKKS